MRKTFFIKFLSAACIFQFLFTAQSACATQSKHASLLKDMFAKVTVAKNDKAIPEYYDKDFALYSNGKKMKYEEFLHLHQKVYETSIQYKVRYDEETFVEQGDKVAGRLFITINKPDEPTREIEVILIAEYKNDKLYRVWELTYPDWSKMKAFQKNSG